MKRIILIVLIIVIMVVCTILVVLNKNQNMEQQNVPLNNNESINDISNNEHTDDEKIDVEDNKYKLSDSYYITSKEEPMPILNVFEEENEGSYIVESDGQEFEIKWVKNTSEDDYRKFIVTINGKELTLFTYPDSGFEVKLGGTSDRIYLIDLDEKDQYKELYIKYSEGMDGTGYIFRLRKDDIEKLFSFDYVWDELIKVGNNWIVTEYFYNVDNYNFSEGFSIYENEELIHVDKFVTGEDITDENGFYPDNFQKIEFNNIENDSIFFYTNDKSIYGYFNLVSKKKTGDINKPFEYSIRVTHDSYYSYEDENGNTIKEPIPDGTVIEGVGVSYIM